MLSGIFFFFFPLLEQMRGWGDCSPSRPREDLRPARGGAGNRAGRKLRWPVGPRLHLLPHHVNSLSPPRSLAFTHKHHSSSLGRRRRQPKEAGLQEEGPLCVIQSGTWLRPGAAASLVTEE